MDCSATAWYFVQRIDDTAIATCTGSLELLKGCLFLRCLCWLCCVTCVGCLKFATEGEWVTAVATMLAVSTT